MERSNLRRTTFRSAFVLILVVVVSGLFLAVVWQFLTALLLGAMLAGLLQPFHRWVKRLCRGRQSLAAALTLLALFVLIVGPFSALLGVVVQQALEVSDQAIPWVKKQFGGAGGVNVHDWISGKLPSSIAPYLPSQEKLLEYVGTAARSAGQFMLASVQRMTTGTAAFLLDFFVMMYAVFFFLRDGGQILERIFYYLPLNDDDEVRLVQRFGSITRATVKGTLVIGFVQGFLAGLALWAAGINGAVFWGVVMVVLSIIPGIGAALVWVPAVIYLYSAGKTLPATLVAVWCAAVVGTVDNVLRPMLVGKDAKMPDLLILIGTLGGLFLFGPIGFIAGPVVCGLFLLVWEIYGATFKDVLPPAKSFRTGLRSPSDDLERATTSPVASKLLHPSGPRPDEQPPSA